MRAPVNRPKHVQFAPEGLDETTLQKINREWTNDNFELIESPRTDYLVLGLFADEDTHAHICTWLAAHSFYESSHMYIERGNIHVHGKCVGKIGNSRSNVSRYGKKIACHFRGEWFRSVEEGEGAGLLEADALRLLRLFSNHLVKQGVAPSGWLRFISIDRWDCTLEVKTDRSIYDIIEKITLPPAWAGREGSWGEGGDTVYIGTTKSPKSTRGSNPHLCVYRKLERPDRVRFEMRIPKIRNVDPKNSFGQEAAAQLVANVLDSFSPRQLRVVEQREKYGVHALDFGVEAIPQEFYQRPYSGHAPKTLRRMARQGLTVLTRSLRSSVTASLIATAGVFAPVSMTDAYENLPSATARDRITPSELSYDFAPREALVELQTEEPCEVFTAPSEWVAPFSYTSSPRLQVEAPAPQLPDHPDCLDPERWCDETQLTPADFAPYAYGATIQELSDDIALNLDELYELHAALWDYQKIKHPDAKPYWEAFKDHVGDRFGSSSTFPPVPASVRQSRCANVPRDEDDRRRLAVCGEGSIVHDDARELYCESAPISLLRSIAESDMYYVKRYLTPFDHEALRTSRRWQALTGVTGITMYRPERYHDVAQGELKL